jgi:hypothetical protein
LAVSRITGRWLVRESAAQPPQHLEPVQARHHHVQHDQRRLALERRLQPRLPVDRLHDLEARQLERDLEVGADVLVVVDDQDACAHRSPCATGASASSPSPPAR